LERQHWIFYFIFGFLFLFVWGVDTASHEELSFISPCTVAITWAAIGVSHLLSREIFTHLAGRGSQQRLWVGRILLLKYDQPVVLCCLARLGWVPVRAGGAHACVRLHWFLFYGF
jgi:hypothetical protein